MLRARSTGFDLDKLLAECDNAPDPPDDGEPVERRGASQVEVCGFVAWVTSGALYFMYLLWAFLPQHILRSVGVEYYPDKHWALAIPTWCCMFVAYTFTGYECLVKMRAVPPTSRCTLQDTTPQWSEEQVRKMWEREKELLPLKDIHPVLATKMLFRKSRGVDGDRQQNRPVDSKME